MWGGEAEGGRRSVCLVEAEWVLGVFFEAEREGARCVGGWRGEAGYVARRGLRCR